MDQKKKDDEIDSDISFKYTISLFIHILWSAVLLTTLFIGEPDIVDGLITFLKH